MSQPVPLTLAITAASARPLEMPMAMSKGVVTLEVPSLTLPSGRVI